MSKDNELSKFSSKEFQFMIAEPRKNLVITSSVTTKGPRDDN